MFCPNCGKEVSENERFCPYCGYLINNAAPSERPNVQDSTDKTAEFTSEDIERSKYLAAICYIGVIFMILALVVEPDSKFIRYHINQSIVISLFAIVCGLVCIIPILGWIVGGIGSIAVVVFTIMGIIRALNGNAKDLPLIGKYSIVSYK